MNPFKILGAAAVVSAGLSAPALAGGVDIVEVRSLNAGFASCNPLPHTYYHNASRTVYFGAEILCQATLAYIKYDRKAPFT